jgi:L-cystine uptake protein TcyP (sodium:dicarboxylate symporter family)
MKILIALVFLGTIMGIYSYCSSKKEERKKRELDMHIQLIRERRERFMHLMHLTGMTYIPYDDGSLSLANSMAQERQNLGKKRKKIITAGWIALFFLLGVILALLAGPWMAMAFQKLSVLL